MVVQGGPADDPLSGLPGLVGTDPKARTTRRFCAYLICGYRGLKETRVL
jgi:hypothetical protein